MKAGDLIVCTNITSPDKYGIGHSLPVIDALYTIESNLGLSPNDVSVHRLKIKELTPTTGIPACGSLLTHLKNPRTSNEARRFGNL